ncbi:ATP-dependent helicase [Candidatus Mycoplasma haematohominis]|uniref:DNA 3'-5' helicase n=1 Tax=Candidatus Mycoplasma haematohominis TaxID=1494318 RepID=A0A478FQS3_9MOLU|nr:ATP-dependent helicase [Candidatus Mycoplasma haemohominis]GCE63928.1 ATP-dependent DNA helicase UvrD1 [Candidatus Mycoplasma haemohominis]
MPIKLNPEQKAIVSAPNKPILVIAAAGTGKTRVLTERIIHLMNKSNIPPEQILSITFTNMAAEEMKERIQRRIKDSHRIPTAIGTIHSIFSDILRRDIEKICKHRKHSFEILQEEGQNWALKRAFQILNLENSFHKSRLNGIRNLLSDWKTGNFLGIKIISEENIEKYSGIFKEYEKILREKNLMDFDDVLILTSQLLSEYPEIKNYWTAKYKAILIDEVQDLNEIQWRLISKLITNESPNFLAVGDPNQCIYLFNRAKEDIFEVIEKTFPNLIKYELIQNYRSAENIVSLSNEIKHIKFSNSVSSTQQIGEVIHCDSLTEALNELLKSQDYSNWAIIFPKHSDVKEIVELLIKNNIPFKSSRFFLLENPHIEKIILLFQAIFFDNSSPLENILCSKEIKISSHAKKEIINPSNWGTNITLSEFLLDGEEWKNLHVDTADMSLIENFINSIKQLKSLPTDNLSNLVPHLKNFLFANTKLTAASLGKIDLFIEWLKNIQPNPSEESSEDIVMNFKNYSEFSKEEINKKKHNSITLSTVHRSKGLEWNKVIVLEYNYLLDESNSKTKDKHLAYVAITRAKEKLLLVK